MYIFGYTSTGFAAAFGLLGTATAIIQNEMVLEFSFA